MTQPADPLTPIFNTLNPITIPFGPSPDSPIELVESFDQYPLEYAATRKSVALFARPDLATIHLTGQDTHDFLHRLLTNDIKSLKPGQLTRAFFLGRDGRIHADILCLVDENTTTLITDAFTAPTLTEELDHFIFTDDVQLTNTADDHYTIQLIGPNAQSLLTATADSRPTPLDNLTHQTLTIAGQLCTIHRCDTASTPTLNIITPRNHTQTIYEKLVSLVGGMTPDTDPDNSRPILGRPIGWAAYNTLRIESGQPLFQIDFAKDSLPAETGSEILNQTVSFNKGCYPGQEIVARMQSRGQVKKSIVGLKFNSNKLPLAGNEVYHPTDNTPIGAITSSTLSPILGEQAIALAVMASDFCQPETQVKVPAEGTLITGQITELPFTP